jgi:hypothetical protein
MTAEPRKTIDADIRERMEAACRAIMADHPEVEAIGVMFLSKQLVNVLAGMIIGAEGPALRPDQNVRLFEVWTRIGAQLLANNQRDVQVLDQMLGQYARRLANAQAEVQGAHLQRAEGPPPGVLRRTDGPDDGRQP